MRILYVGSLPFEPESGTPYHLSVALARHVLVTYLNPPLSVSSWLRYRHILQRLTPAVEVVSVILPRQLRFLPRRLRPKLILPVMLRRLGSIDPKELVLWVSISSLSVPLYRRLQPTLTFYHRLDDFGAMNPSLIDVENQLESISDVIFVVSPNLQQQHRARGREAVLLPNAVDLELFAKTLDGQTRPPSDLQSIPPPRIGFVGTFSPDWIDVDLVAEIARRRVDWSVVIIGSVWKKEVPSLPPNVYVMGKRPYFQLPQYLSGLDVCLVPFKNNPITHGASPLKLYEYLAAGRAVVSTPVPDLPAFETVVWCAEDVPSFIRAIQEALTVAHDPYEQRRRVEAVAPHSWDARARTLIQHLTLALATARQPPAPDLS
jgi:glycosyltransferase involved in cell wall biosynthesis